MSGAALEGVVIADFSRVLAGPYATMLLADLGAHVIKVERPVFGDDTRAWGPPYAADGQSTYYHSVNRNKELIELDLKQPADRARAHDLIARADVFIENFKPGAAEAMGLGPMQLRAAHPRLITCSINGFGSGEGADLPGYDLLAQATGGLMSITGTDAPTKVGVALVDVLTGAHAAIGILAALHARSRSGEGQHIEVSLLTSLLSGLANQASAFVGAGVVPGRLGNDHPSITPYGVYEAQDRPMIIAVGNDNQFRHLAAVIGLDENGAFETNASRVAHRDALREQINARLAAASADVWQERLTAVGVPCGPINDIGQAFALAERLGLHPIARCDDGTRTVANPIRFSQTPATYRTSPPKLASAP